MLLPDLMNYPWIMQWCQRVMLYMLTLKTHVLRSFPSSIESINHIPLSNDILDTYTTHHVYCRSRWDWIKTMVLGSCVHDALVDYTFENDGFYAIRVWNSTTLSYESYVLSVEQLCQALHITSLSFFGHVYEHAIVDSLHAHVHAHKNKLPTKWMDITLNKVSIKNAIAPYASSCLLKDNLSPYALTMLYCLLSGDPPTDYFSQDPPPTLCLTDLDLNDHSFPCKSDTCMFCD